MSQVVFSNILNGAKPSHVFRSYLGSDRSLTKYDVAQRFAEEFSNVDSVSHQIIWNWQSPNSENGSIQDSALDEILIDLLLKSGYIVE